MQDISIYEFAKKFNPKIKRESGKHYYHSNISMNVNKLKKILKK